MYSRSIAENTAANANVGAAIPAATNRDGDPMTYTFGGTDSASFNFNAKTRQITTRAGITYDFEADSSYTVTVTADAGDAGTAMTTVTITLTDVNEPPVAPIAPTVTAAGSSTSLSVSWTAPANAGKPNIASYDLQYRVGSSGSFTDGPQNVTGTSTTITGLTANTGYEVQVRATNADGDGPWSASGSGSTSANNAPVFSAPTQTRSIPENTAANTNVGAVIPAATDADSDSLTYSMGGADAGSFNFNTGTRQITTKSTITYDFEAKSTYTVTVTADDSKGGTAVTTVTVTLTDVDEPPDAPAAPTVTAASTTVLGVTWTAPVNAGKPNITNYDLRYRVGNSGNFVGPQYVTRTSALIGGLTAGTTYEFQVRALNADGSSLWSVSGSGTTSTGPIAQGSTPAVGITRFPASLALTELHASYAEGDYEVVLDTDPGTGITVTVTPTSGEPTAATVSPGSLEFTGGPSGNWSTAKTVTVTAVNDADTVSETFNITHAIAAPVGNDYENVTAGNVAVAVTDAGHGVIVSPTTVSVRENGGTASYGIRLQSAPGGTVAVTPTSSDASHATVSGAVSFNDANWNTPKTVTVTAAGAATDRARITHAVTMVTTAYPSSLTVDPVAVTVTVTAAPDTTAPVLSTATVNGTALTLTYNEALDTSSTPAATAFAVTVAGAARTVSAVAVSGSAVTLTLSGAVTHGQTVTLSYAVPNANPIQDAAGNDAAALTNQAVTNSTPDTTAPLLLTRGVSGAELLLIYSEALDPGSVPAADAFTVTVAGSSRTVSGVRIDKITVFLTLDSAVISDQTVLLSYAVPTSKPIQDAAGNMAAALTDLPVNNSTRPILSTATVNGDSLVLTYDTALDESSVPAAGDFAVTVAGSSRTVSSVSVSGAAVTLTLSSAVTHGQMVTLDYVHGTDLIAAASSGNDAAVLTDQAVTNNTPDPTALPEITIALTSSATLTEGGNATFTVSADPAPSTELTVNLTVADAPGADFVAAGDQNAQTVTIAADASSAAYAVATAADAVDEPSGPVTVTVAASAAGPRRLHRGRGGVGFGDGGRQRRHDGDPVRPRRQRPRGREQDCDLDPWPRPRRRRGIRSNDDERWNRRLSRRLHLELHNLHRVKMRSIQYFFFSCNL